jgi:hypothetical protein
MTRPEHEPASDLRYIRSISPRLRTSEDSQLAAELAEEVARASVDEKHTPIPPPEPQQPHIGPPPDGGLRAWLVVVGSAFSIFCVLGLVTGAGQFQAYYLTHQLAGYTQSKVAWLASIQITLTFGGAVISGALFDAYSAQPLVIVSTLGQFGSLVAVACKWISPPRSHQSPRSTTSSCCRTRRSACPPPSSTRPRRASRRTGSSAAAAPRSPSSCRARAPVASSTRS